MMGSTTNFLKTSSRLSSEDIVSLITYQVSLLKNRLTVHNGSIELRCLSFHDMKMKESEKVTPYTMSYVLIVPPVLQFFSDVARK